MSLLVVVIVIVVSVVSVVSNVVLVVRYRIWVVSESVCSNT